MLNHFVIGGTIKESKRILYTHAFKPMLPARYHGRTQYF